MRQMLLWTVAGALAAAQATDPGPKPWRAITVPNPPPTDRVPHATNYAKPQFPINSIDVTSFDVPEEIRNFYAEVQPPSAAAVTTAELADDLRAMALALRAVPNAPPDMLRLAGEISVDANAIQRGPAGVEIPALADAVTTARQALTRFVVPDALQPRYQEALVRIDVVLSKLERYSSIAAQSRLIDSALDSVATALVLALGHDPADLQRAPEERVFVRGCDRPQQIEQLRQRLGRVASEEDVQARRETIRLLDDLADAIGEASPAANPALGRMRQTLDELRRSEDINLIRRAIAQGVDALGALDRSDVRWLEAAQASAANVVGGKPFALQRAEIQDALRSLIDAFAAIVQA